MKEGVGRVMGEGVGGRQEKLRGAEDDWRVGHVAAAARKEEEVVDYVWEGGGRYSSEG